MSLVCFPRILQFEGKLPGLISCLPKVVKVQSANIVSKEFKDPNVKKPAPWPYQQRLFNLFHWYIDGTKKRFDENSKIIVVDGNIGAGKSNFAKQLADAFDMLYLPEPTMENYFVSPYGYDMRKIDDILPPSYKCCDIKTFYSNPHHQNVGKFQFRMMSLRINQYVDALAHLLNTGQGVVLERSTYSEFVFVETMHKFGYLSSPAKQLYYDCHNNAVEELWRPHLVIYLDISPEVALERIKKRNDPAEVNSKVLTKEYLETIEHFYKQKFLKDIETHAELLIYDWNNYGDVEVVVEDIERIDFDRFTIYDDKLKDWKYDDDWILGWYRRQFTTLKRRILDYACIYRPKVKELFHPGEEVLEFHEILKKIPGERYANGFNPAAGDNVWFKTVHEKGKRFYAGPARWHRSY
ncbi:NADH dehydrogenase [ubiquinone] 1 alpha subcomplex subunit 10, mitochondrial-like [Uloborus diversus]|uniref:NADH dehydrogenase [ubiquinone] 1 alpha subcomplex subunit 10, mitochondrial-like n=1 Tax=Uloborus diversus TaxID=327109 RepID=UPI002409839D|nr:NADH dehydrogenase [ubiquinone] 1 alpha subcomplex subunit 10, mitochondrial-like [Uloborus diversus]